jgi:sulfur carrier protein ThiS
VSGIGDNIRGNRGTFSLRLFNTVSRFAKGACGGICLTLPAGSSVADVLEQFSIPESEVFLVLVNGKDITPGLYGDVRTDYYLQDGDVLALSGPVPYSWGYGAPIV